MKRTQTLKADPKKPPKKYGALNKVFTTALEKTQNVLDASNDEKYHAAILQGGITQEFLDALQGEVNAARGFLTDAVSQRGSRKDATTLEHTNRTTLVHSLQAIQSRALQKFHIADPNRPRDTYYVGTALQNVADAMLEQISVGIIAHARADELPAITDAFLFSVNSQLEAWKSSLSAQKAQGGLAITDLAQFKTALSRIESQRRTI